MITLKAVLVGSSCVGVLAVGGVTYATVAHPHAGLRSDQGKLPAAAKPAAPAVPAPAKPKCLPNVEQHAKKHAQEAGDAAKNAAGKAHSLPAPQAPQVPGAPNAPQVPAAPQVPNAPQVPGGATCLPSELPKVDKPALPAKPDVPQLPPVSKVSCDSVKPAVALGGPAEQAVILSRGLSHGTKQVEAITYKGHKLCKVTEKWAGAAGQWLKVERLQTPQALSFDQLRQAMQLPAGGAPVNLSGRRGWATPLGGVVFWNDANGFAVFVSGSPAYATQVQDVAAKLQQQAQQVR